MFLSALASLTPPLPPWFNHALLPWPRVGCYGWIATIGIYLNLVKAPWDQESTNESPFLVEWKQVFSSNRHKVQMKEEPCPLSWLSPGDEIERIHVFSCHRKNSAEW